MLERSVVYLSVYRSTSSIILEGRVPERRLQPIQVIVGGTKIVDDYYPAPRPETAEDILRRGFELCPELAPPEIRA